MTKEEFGDRVYVVRKLLHLSQLEFANKCGLEHSHVGMIERGRKNVTIATIDKIAGGLGITFAELFGEEMPKIAEYDPETNQIIAYLAVMKPAQRRTLVDIIRILMRDAW